MQHSVTLATGQSGRRSSSRYWIPGVSALMLVLSLSIYATHRTDPSLVSPHQIQRVDAGSVVVVAPIDANLPIDLAAPLPDLLKPSRSRARPIFRDDELVMATKAYTARSWAEAASHALGCEDRGEAKYKCPWILGMATCQMMRTNDDPKKRPYLDSDLTYALALLREQNELQLAKEIEQSCAALGVSISSQKQPSSPADPSQIKNPFL